MVERYTVYVGREEIGYILFNADKNLFSMSIERPDLFPDRLDKLFFTDEKFREWYDRRLTPQYQKGYSEFVKECGVDINSSNHRWELFIATRGANVKDKLWVAFSSEETYETHCPWYILKVGKKNNDNN